MTTLQTLIALRNLCPVRVMNVLQENGKVSDCAVWPEDVPDSDSQVAVAFLRGLPKEERLKLVKKE